MFLHNSLWKKSSEYFWWVIVGVIFLSSMPAKAHNNADVSKQPAVCFLSTASAPVDIQIEREIALKMAFTLTQFRVVYAVPPIKSFSKAHRVQRTKLIEQIAAKYKAVAVVWVDQSPSGTWLYLAAIDQKHSVVRIVEAHENAGAPADLALIVEELLGLTHLFEKTDANPPTNQSQPDVPTDTSEKTNPSAKNSSQYTAPPPWSIILSGGMGGGLFSYKGPSKKIIGVLAFERSFENGLFLFPELHFLISNENIQNDFSHRAIGGAVFLGVGYGFQLGNFVLSPMLAVGASWHKLHVAIVDTDAVTLSYGSGNIGFGLRLQWKMNQRIFVAVSPGVVLNTVQQYFHRTSNEEVVYTSPRIEWQVLGRLGIRL